MRKLTAVLLLLAGAAWAGEKYLGTIYVSDAGTASNASTGYGGAGCATGPAGSCVQAFAIGSNTKLTLQSDVAFGVNTDVCAVDAGSAIQVAANEKFPTSTAYSVTRCSLPDGGSYSGGAVAITPAVGSATAPVRVYSRTGTE